MRRRTAAPRLLVVRHHLRRERRERLLPVAWSRMGAQELRRAAAADLLHLLPERDGRVRVVAGLGRELDADAVGFGLGGAAVRQLDRELGRERRGAERRAVIVP